MMIAEAIRNLEHVERDLTLKQAAHPDAVVVPCRQNGHYNYKLYTQHRNGISFADAHANIAEVIARLRKVEIEHPQADIFPRTHKKRFAFLGALPSGPASTFATITPANPYDNKEEK